MLIALRRSHCLIRITDTCQGDSGGPVMSYSEKERLWVLVGITSYGRGCGLQNSAGVYTRLSRYIEWIRSIVGTEGMVIIPQSEVDGTTAGRAAHFNKIPNLLLPFAMMCWRLRTFSASN